MNYMCEAGVTPGRSIIELSFAEIEMIDGAGRIGNAARWIAGGAGIAAGVSAAGGALPAAAAFGAVAGVALLVAAVDGD